jgi:hypothetical protein
VLSKIPSFALRTVRTFFDFSWLFSLASGRPILGLPSSQPIIHCQITCQDDLAEMAKQLSEADKALSQLHFLYTFFQNGLNRIAKMIGSETFSFVVNGHRFESTIVESIFLSPAVEEMLLSGSCSHEFYILDSSIDSNGFSLLLDFIRCDQNHDSISLSASTSAFLLKRFSNQIFGSILSVI